jgi:hypothetical protein
MQDQARPGKARQGKARQGKIAKAMQGKARHGRARQGKAQPGQHQCNTRARTGGKARNETRERPQEGREKREKENQNRWPTIEGLFLFCSARDISEILELRVFVLVK